MSLRGGWFVSFGLWSLGVAVWCHGERLSISVYTNQEGLPQRQVLAITQDDAGYLWVGTYGGLSRFNGRTFRTLRTRDGLSSNSIVDAVPAPRGRMWVGTAGGGVCLLQALSTLRCFRAPDALTSDDILDLEDDGDGGVWVGSYNGVAHLRADGNHRTFSSAGTTPLRYVWSVKRFPDRVLLGFAGGVAEVRGNAVYVVPIDVPGGRVRALLLVPPWLYIGGEKGLFRSSFPALHGALESVVPGVFVQDLAYARGVLWVATRSGLLRQEGGRLSHLKVAHGLPSDVELRLFFDREGTLWVGTEAGLAKITNGPFTTFSMADGLPNNFVRAVAADAHGTLWVGTRGGLALSTTGRFREVLPKGIAGTRVYDILALPSGEVWVATNDGAVHLRGGRVAQLLREDDGLPDSAVYALAFDETTGELFLGTWAGTACLKNGDFAPLPAELARARPLAMHIDRRGRLWAALRDGQVLLRERDGTFQTLGAKEGLSDQVVWSIASDDRGVWLATNGDGALHVTDHGVQRWDTQRGLVDDFVWQVLPDGRGRVWLFTSQGLDRLEGNTIRHFSLHDGLPDLEGSANACAAQSSEALWFGTPSGLARFDPGRELEVSAPPPVLLETATFGNGATLTPEKTLPPDRATVAFSLVSLTFRNEKALRYSYRLLPVQPQWSPPQPQGEVTFAGLGPGRYRFEGVAIDAGGRRSSRPATLAFSVAAPWWQHPVALLSGAWLLLAASAGWARWRLARLRTRAQELENLVTERTRQLEEKAHELARLAETDELTHLPNRRRFFRTLREELQHLWRAPRDARLCLLLLDLDGFKAINDTLGHNAGDALLQAVANALQGAVRSTDTVARFGGDEFAVILPMTDRTGATVAAAKLLRAAKGAAIEYAGQRLSVTASAGLAVVAPSAAFTEDEVTRLLHRADVALYAAKQRGGNVVLDDEATWA